MKMENGSSKLKTQTSTKDNTVGQALSLALFNCIEFLPFIFKG